MPRDKLPKLWINLALEVAKLSTCKRLQVGCVITNESLEHVLGIGYNGNFKDGPNVCDSEEAGSCGCIHGEVNALLKTSGRDQRKVMFVSDSPCVACAKLIINAGIVKLYFKNYYRNLEGIKLLESVIKDVWLLP